ncbi:MAG: Rieske (2Fe-2S) protein [Gammaproteobacteria bacterium]|nr:Rieske (2Fe-2S) protein [Gammaproteobacteria bacterium]
MPRIVLCEFSQLDDPGSMGIIVNTARGQQELFVVRNNNRCHAYFNSCPHTGAPLNWQDHRFLNYDKTLIMCSLHGAQFRISDGRCLHGPCVGAHLSRIDTEIDNGIVYWLNS